MGKAKYINRKKKIQSCEEAVLGLIIFDYLHFIVGSRFKY